MFFKRSHFGGFFFICKEPATEVTGSCFLQLRSAFDFHTVFEPECKDAVFPYEDGVDNGKPEFAVKLRDSLIGFAELKHECGNGIRLDLLGIPLPLQFFNLLLYAFVPVFVAFVLGIELILVLCA